MRRSPGSRSGGRRATSRGSRGRSCRRRPPTTPSCTSAARSSMTWTRGGRELAISGRLPLEHGLAFEQAIRSIAKEQRAVDKKAGAVLEWQQYTADALVTLEPPVWNWRRRHQAQPDDADRPSQRRRAADPRGRRADQPRDRRAALLRRTPARDPALGPRPRPRARHALRVLRAATRAVQALRRTASSPAARSRSTSTHTTSWPTSAAARPCSTT